MMKWLISIFSTSYVAAATYNAATVAYSDVSNAVALSTVGDTVVVPAGTVTWTNTLTLTNGITLRGAGAGQTTIYGTGNNLIYFNLSADNPARVTGFSFTNIWDSSYACAVYVLGDYHNGSSGPSTAVRIDHCNFLGGGRTVYFVGQKAYGLVDHCNFTNGMNTVAVQAFDNLSWDEPFGLGTTNAVVVENCVFYQTGLSLGTQVYNEEGARFVVRSNTFIKLGTGDYQFVECHGNQNYYTGTGADYRGCLFGEVYGNTFVGENYRRITYWRSGTILSYNNAFNITNVYEGATLSCIQITDEETHRSSLQPNHCDWPFQDAVTNSYFWGNTLRGTSMTTIDDETGGYCTNGVFVVNTDYWLSDPRTTTTTNRSGAVNVLSGYTPLAYPHPRVTAEDAVVTAATVIGLLSVGTIQSP